MTWQRLPGLLVLAVVSLGALPQTDHFYAVELTRPSPVRVNHTTVDDFITRVADMPVLNPYVVPALVLDHDWGGQVCVLGGRMTGLRSLHRSESLIMRLATTVVLRSTLEMGPVDWVFAVVLSQGRIIGPPLQTSIIYNTRHNLRFQAHVVTMNFSAGTDFNSGKSSLQLLFLRKVHGLNAFLDAIDSYGRVMNTFTSMVNRHAERLLRYLGEDVLRTYMDDTIRFVNFSAESLLRSYLPSQTILKLFQL
ncbi:hypothetical protein HPB51_028643 [Rhipicephalus microplus]|uniref:Uncharacterized protein n=1 Tax=Rhipicephalus microplus TaxID=6941 RepID=A0A9J6CWC5_RHIMP|nr:hypothetical protein HPB51_028643 [Rhipicephalus microplus]